MLTLKNLNMGAWLTTWISVRFARECLHLWEAEYPENEAPRKAIELTEAWLYGPAWLHGPGVTLDQLNKASHAAINAGHKAVNNRYIRSREPYHSNYSSAFAAGSAAASTFTGSAFKAGTNASFALGVSRGSYFHLMLSKHLTFIIDCKIKHNEGFGNFEEVFEAATEADKEKLLFHLEKTND
tara:strand:+ start:126 stop:674 length:549 start_codon:yes stop_codon:yes gene_type:complete